MGQAREVVERFYERFGAGDFDGAEACFTPDCTNVEPFGGTMDMTAWRQYGEAFKAGVPDAHMEVDSFVEDGDRVAVQARFVGVHSAPLMTPQGELPPSGRAIDLAFADFFALRDGKIAEHRVYYDQMAFMQQLGLMPESPAG
ncbi:MAG TPA: ester cyclase [Actinomycetota bacterium]|nr:ester cyclase [Actinomycetota bacterium]